MRWGSAWAVDAHLVSSIQECTRRCLSIVNCRFGTYVSAGNRKRECWLSEKENTRPYTSTKQRCGVPCQSFVKLPGYNEQRKRSGRSSDGKEAEEAEEEDGMEVGVSLYHAPHHR
jgi:hypothetical protein